MPTDREPALRVVGFRKAFGDHLAVDDIHLTVPAGSFYGLVGPNGAGKTTTLAMAGVVVLPAAPRSSAWTSGVTPYGPRG